MNSQKVNGAQKIWPLRIWGIVGLLAYLVVGAFPYLTSGLMVPGPWLYILWAIWLVGAWVAWRTFQRRPAMVLLFAPAAVAFWFLYVTAGEATAGLDCLGRSTLPCPSAAYRQGLITPSG